MTLHQVTFKDNADLEHDWGSSMIEWNKGQMDGFSAYGTKQGPHQAYAYVQHSQIEPYRLMAKQYVLADEMFPTEFGGSFTAHLTLVAGTDDIKLPSEAEVNFPSHAPDDCDSQPGTKSSYLTPDRVVHFFDGPFPCFDQFNTIAQVLDNAQVSWKMYATRLLDGGFWEPFEAIKYVRYGSDWSNNIIAPQSTFLTDASSGKLASVSWVTPTRPDSDHPAYKSDQGPSWVASIVNAVGSSQYWSKSAIIVVWDDWGGFYDNAPPPQLDYRGLGMRVPCLIISPYAKHGVVVHTQYEYGSILRFIEEVNGLPPGSIGSTPDGYTDARAKSLDDAFDFTQQPRKFKAIPSKYPISHFVHERRITSRSTRNRRLDASGLERATDEDFRPPHSRLLFGRVDARSLQRRRHVARARFAGLRARIGRQFAEQFVNRPAESKPDPTRRDHDPRESYVQRFLRDVPRGGRDDDRKSRTKPQVRAIDRP